MDSLTLQINDQKLFDLIRLDNSNESFELVPGQNQEIMQGLTLKVDELGNGILEIAQNVKVEVKISGKRVAEVAQFRSNDLITIDGKDFLLISQEGAVINHKICALEIERSPKFEFNETLECSDEKIDFDIGLEITAAHVPYHEDQHELLEMESANNARDNDDGIKKQKRKNIFSLFTYSSICIIIATLGFLLFMNSKISDYNRIADMANIFQRKIARLLNQKPKSEIKKIQTTMEQLFHKNPISLTTPLPEVAKIKKKKKSKVATRESELIPQNNIFDEKPWKKPSLPIRQKDRERVLKEIEMLELEYRLDPYYVRKSLQEMRDSISDQTLRRKIDQTLQRL